MENTLSLLLQDTQNRWYSYGDNSLKGPISAKDIAQAVQAGSLSWGASLWKDGMEGWKRLYELPEFLCLLPSEPPANVLEDLRKKLKAAAAPMAPGPGTPTPDQRIWYVHIEGTQYGPFSGLEVRTLIDVKRVTVQTYFWRQGFSEWVVATAVPEWATLVTAQNIPQLPTDKRAMPRRPFQAKILLTDGNVVGQAICRDVSKGGMQVLMDGTPAPVGTKLRLNISSGGKIADFTCEGVVVRLLEDRRGFSFRFSQLPADAAAAIEKYVES